MHDKILKVAYMNLYFCLLTVEFFRQLKSATVEAQIVMNLYELVALRKKWVAVVDTLDD